MNRRHLLLTGLGTVGAIITGSNAVGAGEFFEKGGVAIRGYDPVA
jgi:hypothetical protein